MSSVVVSVEDLSKVIGLLAVCFFVAGFLGVLAFRMVEEIAASLGSIVRRTQWWNEREGEWCLRLARDARFLANFPHWEREERRVVLLKKAARFKAKADAAAARRESIKGGRSARAGLR